MSYLRFGRTHIVYLYFKHCKASANQYSTVQRHHNINVSPEEISQSIFLTYSQCLSFQEFKNSRIAMAISEQALGCLNDS